MDTREAVPTIASAVVFRAKASLLQLRRSFRNLFVERAERFTRSERSADAPIIAESRTPIWRNTEGAEWELEAGKVHNLRKALRNINGLEIPAGRVFSFWAHIGRPIGWRGYARGRELREGCIIPSIGGGLCQLSNSLYDAALRAGFEIIERHAHTQVIPGSLAERGRDATVFWNYVDLRFRSNEIFRVEALMTSDHLIVRFRGKAIARGLSIAPRSLSSSSAPNSCASCGVVGCFRNIERAPSLRERTVFLVDQYWPEFDSYIQSERSERDRLGLPIDGKRFNRANYRWEASGFEQVKESRLATLVRAYESRRLSEQGAARVRALLRQDEKLARSFAPLLTREVTRVVVMQNLLPFLWREGLLGGRTFDVLMTRLPIHHLQARLDYAHGLHPESPTLADFRAEVGLARAEAEAFASARRVITPHTEIARLFEGRAVLLDWHIPKVTVAPTKGDKVIFPASTLGRKGAYEMRDAARALGLKVAVVGAQLEGRDFWRGVDVEFRSYDERWLDGGRVVVLGSFVESQPRRLLEAVARQTPVVASTACGLESVPGVVSVAAGDSQALCDAIRNVLIHSAAVAEVGLLSGKRL